MKGSWVEIRGKEKGSDQAVLLFKIPYGQWDDSTATQYGEMLKEAGTTDITFARVNEE